jgi:hypothetical protein
VVASRAADAGGAAARERERVSVPELRGGVAELPRMLRAVAKREGGRAKPIPTGARKSEATVLRVQVGGWPTGSTGSGIFRKIPPVDLWATRRV